MEISELMDQLKSLNVKVRLNDNSVTFEDEKGVLSDELKEVLNIRSDEVVAYLSRSISVNGDHVKYWEEELRGIPGEMGFPVDISRSSAPEFSGEKYRTDLGSELLQSLLQLAKENDSSPELVLSAIFTVFMYRYTGTEDILIGTPARYLTGIKSVRSSEDPDNMIALRSIVSGSMKFSELLQHLKEKYGKAEKYLQFPFHELLDHLRLSEPFFFHPVFQHAISFQSGSGCGKNDPCKCIYDHQKKTGLPALDMNWNFNWHDHIPELCIDYNADLFNRESIKRYSKNFFKLASDAVLNSEKAISELMIISDHEREVLHGFNLNDHNFNEKRTFQQWISDIGNSDPGAVSLVYEDQEFTNKELYDRVDKLAAFLQQKGVKPSEVIGIYTDHTPEMIVGILGIMKSGAAYLPLDPKYPAAKKQFMVNDSGVSTILSVAKYRDDLQDYGTKIFLLDSEWDAITRSAGEYYLPVVGDNDLAYVIYTSGSTGTPKGVKATYGNLIAYSLMAIDEYQLSNKDTTLQFGTMNFDVFVEEVFPSFLAGGKLVLRNEESALGGEAFWSFVQQHKITFISLPTAFWQTLCTQLNDKQAALATSVRLLVIGGEALSEQMLALWQKTFGSSIRVINTYGPSETTVVVTGYDCHDFDTRKGKVPIGKPFKNVRCYILDKNLNLCPIGAKGELFIGGAQVSQGYLNRPELTEEKFISDPFSEDENSRLYRSGDICKNLPDGNIQFIGRNDLQVKLRGLRIELGEIESALNKLETVKESVVILREDVQGDKKIVAYIVSAADSLEPNKIRNQLRKLLAGYMIPAAFVKMESIPLTVNGKVDKRALPEPNRTDMAGFGEVVEPQDPMEELLRNIWENVLNISPVSVTDNFFDLGGHSLIAVDLFDELRDKTGIELPLASLLEAPTVRLLSAHINLGRKDLAGSSSSPLVKINAKGNKTPFYCIHGHFGNVLNFANLARDLGEDQPFYGLQGIGISGSDEPLMRIEAIADRYVREIKAIQPEGPYSIGGYCYGTLVALELAKRLRQMGDDIAFLIMFDPQPNLYPELLTEDVIKNFEKFQNEQRLNNHKEEAKRKTLAQVGSYLWDKIVNKLIFLFMTTTLLSMDKLKKVIDFEIPVVFRDVEFTNYLAMNRYVIDGKWKGDVHLILSRVVAEGYSNNPSADWKDLAEGNVQIKFIDDEGIIAGGQMFKKPYVKQTAKELKSILNPEEGIGHIN